MFRRAPPGGSRRAKGTPKQFTRRPGLASAILKVGPLDNPGLYGGAQMAVDTVDKPAFHQIAEGLPAFERLPPRPGCQNRRPTASSQRASPRYPSAAVLGS